MKRMPFLYFLDLEEEEDDPDPSPEVISSLRTIAAPVWSLGNYIRNNKKQIVNDYEIVIGRELNC